MLTADQAALHDKYIGGSDAAVACGLSPWLSARELYYIHRGEMEREPIDPINAFIGHQLEPMIANWYVEEAKVKLRDIKTTRWSKKHPWAMAHPDRIVLHRHGGLELKTAATPEGWGLGGDADDTIPEHYHIQVAHYMEVFDYDWWDVAVFFLISREFRRYHIKRDHDFGVHLMDAEETFMMNVDLGEPPAWDYNHPTTLELMKAVYPGTNGMACDLDKRVLGWWEVLEDSRKLRSQYDATIKCAKAHIVAQMENHSLGYCTDGDTITQKRTSSGSLILSKRKLVNYQ